MDSGVTRRSGAQGGIDRRPPLLCIFYYLGGGRGIKNQFLDRYIRRKEKYI